MRPLTVRDMAARAARRAASGTGRWLSARAGDPAPSRWAHKAQRIWLTPLFRQTLKVGIPAYAVVFGLGLAVQDGAPSQAVAGAVTGAWEGLKARPEFAVSRIEIEGATPETEARVRAALASALPISTFDIEIALFEESLEGIGAIAEAEFALRPGGVLAVAVTERPPALLWRVHDGIAVLDADGVEIDVALRRTEHPDLPIMAGAGAGRDAETALAIVDEARPISERLRGLVRVGNRRWDAILGDDVRIMLPEAGAPEAMRRVVAMHRARGLLDRDVRHVDMRIPGRPTVRLSSAGQRARDEAMGQARNEG